jgi:hypothetical protein
VEATSLYTVTVETKKGQRILQSVVPAGQTELAYPESSDALVAGEQYLVTVVADGNRSSSRAPAQQSVEVLAASTRDQLAADEARISALGISDLASKMLLARLWLHYGLTSEAEALLQTLVGEQPEIATVMLLADTETRGLLYARAIDHYVKTVRTAEQSHDVEAIAIASYQLGQIYLIGQPNPARARQYLTKARDSYRALLGPASTDAIFEKIESDLQLVN